MPSLKESWHFVPTGKIPHFAGNTPFREVYESLARTQAGGFLLEQDDRPVSYVRAYPLAEQVITEANEDLEKLRRRTDQPIREIVAEFSHLAPLVPVHAEPIEVEAEEDPLRQQIETAFSVQQSGLQIGWYLNHETVREAQTERTIFICKRNHRNTDPDSGSCWKCPAPIVRTEKENIP